MILNSKIDGKVEAVDEDKIKVGDIGKAIGRLAPMGKAKISGVVVEVQSTGSFIDHNTEIKVLKIHTNKIIVEPLNKD
jgi:membrane-bound ClpP family serine protease